MESVYTLLNIERGVPEVFGSVYDIRELLKSVYYMNDKKKLEEIDLPLPKPIRKLGLKKVEKTWIKELLEEAHLI